MTTKTFPLRVVLAFAFIAVLWWFPESTGSHTSGVFAGDVPALRFLSSVTSNVPKGENVSSPNVGTLEEMVLPAGGREVSVSLSGIGPQLVDAGVIDREKFLNIYEDNEEMRKEAEQLLGGAYSRTLVITGKNAPVVLNFLWAFGLGNKNAVLEEGPMMDDSYGGAGNFASTGGWTLATGDAMNHYSKHAFVVLTSEQQVLVERVSKNVYRPCCGNSTYFPDCNHGMAMLGLLELLASQGATEDAMYRAALIVNTYWFPDTYLTIAKYLPSIDRSWLTADPRELLSAEYSSGGGYRTIAAKVEPIQRSGGSCGVK